MKGFNSLLGSHYDHYFLEYSFYSTDDIPSETFQVSPSKKLFKIKEQD